jgi:hypothetical protein
MPDDIERISELITLHWLGYGGWVCDDIYSCANNTIVFLNRIKALGSLYWKYVPVWPFYPEVIKRFPIGCCQGEFTKLDNAKWKRDHETPPQATRG